MTASNDLVARLRAWSPLIASGYEVPAAATAVREAADRIEALEAALRDARRYVGYDVPGLIARIDALLGDRT